MALFDVVDRVEQDRRPQARPAVLRDRVRALGVEPDECVFLDDLGINLKPARPWA